MPAQRRRRRKQSNQKKKRRPIIYYAILVISILLVIVYIGSANYWNNDTKLTLAVQESGGEVNLITFNPVMDEITNIKIPSNTEVEVARRFGVFRLGNVWKLGYSEGLWGELLANTITKNFKLPVYIWADSEAVGFASTNYFDIGRAVISGYRTNLKIGDRLRIAAFSIGVPNSRRVEINLSDTQYLKKTRLIDGEEGYVIVKNIPVSILSIFADPIITKNGYRAEIVNNSTNIQIAGEVGEVVEVLGAKVASIKRGENDVNGCVVRGSDEAVTSTIARIFNCSEVNHQNNANIDIEIILGSNFEDYY